MGRWVLIVAGIVCLCAAAFPVPLALFEGISKTVAKRGAASVVGAVLIYISLFVVLGWLGWRVCLNAADNLLAGRRPQRIAPLVTDGSADGTEGVRLAQVLAAHLMAIQKAAADAVIEPEGYANLARARP